MTLTRKILLSAAAALGAGGTGLIISLEQSVKASDLELHPPKYPWYHKGWLSTLDHASVRRGYEVFKNVCAACHSVKYVAYRDLVNKTHTEEEAKAEAAEIMVTDGPDERGEMYQRPGKLSDRFQEPYPNDEAARFANNGALPPDLTLMTLARHGGEDYVFSLLTGYCDAPAGVVVQDGLYYNPYFPGKQIGMAKALYNEAIEYSDGTPATASQMAKDVTTFLKWCAEPHFDERKRMFLKTAIIAPIMFGFILHYNRFIWSILKTMRFEFRKVTKK